MKAIEIIVENKIARAADKSSVIVCGNSDYIINFTFDEEWAEHDVKTARFAYGGKYTDVVFTGNECPAPVIYNTLAVDIGVFAGDLRTTTPALIACERSILCKDGTPQDPPEDVYNKIVGLCEEARNTAKSVETKADNGDFNGEKGDKGERGSRWFRSTSPIESDNSQFPKGGVIGIENENEMTVGDFILSLDGNVFEITSIDDNAFYVKYHTNICGEKGDQGSDGAKWFAVGTYTDGSSTSSIMKASFDRDNYPNSGDFVLTKNGDVFRVSSLYGAYVYVEYQCNIVKPYDEDVLWISNKRGYGTIMDTDGREWRYYVEVYRNTVTGKYKAQYTIISTQDLIAYADNVTIRVPLIGVDYTLGAKYRAATIAYSALPEVYKSVNGNLNKFGESYFALDGFTWDEQTDIGNECTPLPFRGSGGFEVKVLTWTDNPTPSITFKTIIAKVTKYEK